MPILLASLGTSWLIVPEAFHGLVPGTGGFSAVHILTTAAKSIDPGIASIGQWFAERHPSVELTFTRVAGFEELQSEEDHFRFEEVLYRWLLEVAPNPASRHFCLAGGFKTMSAALQKAAAVFGAAEVFHVLADPKVNTPVLVDRALEERMVHYVRLGPESGWPQLHAVEARDYPLETVSAVGRVRSVRAPSTALRERLRETVERSHRIAEAWDALADLPFAELATWPAAELRWLRQPLNPASARDQAWVGKLPKIELHCHLGGFATHGDLLQEVRSAAEHPHRLPACPEPTLPEGWPLPAQPIALPDYLRLGDATGSRLLRDPGCLRRQCELLYHHLVGQGVRYAEIRCSPANYADPGLGRSPWDVLCGIRGTFQKLMQDREEVGFPCHVNLLIIGTRRQDGDDRAAISRHLSLAVTAAEHWRQEGSCRVVGVDLAGYENPGTRAHYFREEFTAVHRCGLALTVHAGENDDAEGIWRAVFDLNARRLGHALSLEQAPELLRSVSARGIGVEMCPYANYQIKGYGLPSSTDAANGPHRGSPQPPPSVCAAPDRSSAAGKSYPLLRYLDQGVRVTVNTDNPGISAANLSDNLLLAARLCPGLTRLDLLRLQRHAWEVAFLEADSKKRLLEEMACSIPHL